MKPNKLHLKISIIIFSLLTFCLVGINLDSQLLEPDFTSKYLPPTTSHLFGTDQNGRDIFARTVSGLSKSLVLGIVASIFSGIIALILGIIAGTAPKWLDDTINFAIDAVMSIPHLVLLILISFALGRGITGVTMGIILTHWTGLARIIRGEVLQLKEQVYIEIGKKLGTSPLKIATKHMLPHLLPQFIIGVVVLFPHAILHESAVTFLGFGLPPEQPTIGIMLSESINFVMLDMWWIFLPAVALILTVLLFHHLGTLLKQLFAPVTLT